MAVNASREPAQVKWSVRVAADALERLAALSRDSGLVPAQILAFALESLASGKPSELRTYVAKHADDVLERTWRAWRFDVAPVTVGHAESVAKEFGVTRQVLVTLVIDCLTEGNGGDGGRRAKLESLLRIIYSSAPPVSGLCSAEVVSPTA